MKTSFLIDNRSCVLLVLLVVGMQTISVSQTTNDEQIIYLFNELTDAPALNEFELTEEQNQYVYTLAELIRKQEFERVERAWTEFLRRHSAELAGKNKSTTRLAAAIVRESSSKELKKILEHAQKQNIQFTSNEMEIFNQQGLSAESRKSYIQAAEILQSMQE